MSVTRRTFIQRVGQLGLAASVAGTFAGHARAQSFPSRPVRIFTPFPAGSGPDAALRMVGDQLSRRWKQPVVIDNRPGGNGFIAVAAFKQGATDGHDLLQLDSTHCTTHPSTFARLPYDVQKDFVPLRVILNTPFFVAVAADSPYKSVDDIVSAARAKPGSVSYGSWFNGSPGHIGGLLLQSVTKVQMLHVPFRDFGQLYAAVASREVDWAMGSVASAGALEKGGRLRFLAVAADQRDTLYPKVPATAELAGLQGFKLSAWAGMFGPAAIAGALQNSIAADIAQALAAPEVVTTYKSIGYEAPDLSPAQFDARIRAETVQWRDVIKSANLRLD